MADTNTTTVSIKDRLEGAQVTDGNRATLGSLKDAVEGKLALWKFQQMCAAVEAGQCGVTSVQGQFPRQRRRGRGRW